VDDVRLNFFAKATEIPHRCKVIDICDVPHGSRRGAGTDSIDGTIDVPDWQISYWNTIDIDLTHRSVG